jgi:hypothetical protein
MLVDSEPDWSIRMNLAAVLADRLPAWSQEVPTALTWIVQ